MSKEFFDTGPEPADTPLSEDIPEPAVSTEERASPARTKKPKRQILGYDLPAVLGGAAAIVALLVYALWPEPTPQSQFVDEPVQHQESIAPAEPLTPPPSVIPDVAPPAAETVPVSPEPEAESNKELEASVTSLSGRQDNSDKRIDALEARINALEQLPRPPVSPAAPVRKATPHKSVARSTPARTTTAHRSGVTGWRINSVYPGMAWLSDGKSTWAVYPGDTLNGMRIDAIDATRREVRTSRGVIRQGG
ncbi:MAG TPA: hypothetical protein VGL07_19045 [Buttiauxella sp.]|jgi:hypothetical protein